MGCPTKREECFRECTCSGARSIAVFAAGAGFVPIRKRAGGAGFGVYFSLYLLGPFRFPALDAL